MIRKLLLYSILVLCLPSCYIIRAYKNRHLDLTSHTKLPFVSIAKGSEVFHFPVQKDASLGARLDTELQFTNTAAFLVVHNDTIVYERYFNGFDEHSLLPSFSVVKSFVATLAETAHEEGKIRSFQQPLTDYLPKFLDKDPRFANITIQHLLDMKSGLNWNESSYGLKDDAVKMGFRPNITPYVYKVKIREAPGKFEYQSINTMLLAMIVEKATGKHISEYLSDKLWQQVGMESDATWNTDKRRREIAYAGLNATARDFAKFGSLYLHKGMWLNKRIVTEEWINSIRQGMGSDNYKNQFWGSSSYRDFTDSMAAVNAAKEVAGAGRVRAFIGPKAKARRFYFSYPSATYYAEGILGQFIVINPDKNLLIVRFGHNWKHPLYSLQNFIFSLNRNLY